MPSSLLSHVLKRSELIFGHPRMMGVNTLANFLIMPIQRIPRYSLLLNELIKNTPPDHPDLLDLKSSLNKSMKSPTRSMLRSGPNKTANLSTKRPNCSA
jgi:hypothetical protein